MWTFHHLGLPASTDVRLVKRQPAKNTLRSLGESVRFSWLLSKLGVVQDWRLALISGFTTFFRRSKRLLGLLSRPHVVSRASKITCSDGTSYDVIR